MGNGYSESDSTIIPKYIIIPKGTGFIWGITFNNHNFPRPTRNMCKYRMNDDVRVPFNYFKGTRVVIHVHTVNLGNDDNETYFNGGIELPKGTLYNVLNKDIRQLVNYESIILQSDIEVVLIPGKYGKVILHEAIRTKLYEPHCVK